MNASNFSYVIVDGNYAMVAYKTHHINKVYLEGPPRSQLYCTPGKNSTLRLCYVIILDNILKALITLLKTPLNTLRCVNKLYSMRHESCNIFSLFISIVMRLIYKSDLYIVLQECTNSIDLIVT